MIYIILFFSTIFLPLSVVSAGMDLEKNLSPFVLETKKIEVPGYPHAFNASIIRWRGSLLMSFRIIPYPRFTTFNSRIGIVWLDDSFNPIGEPQLLEVSDPYSLIPSRAEDARLVCIQDKLWMVYSDNRDSFVSRGGFRVYIAELENNGKKFEAKNIQCLSKFEGESQERREKNWTPFIYNDEMLLAYSMTPHLIFKPILGTKECETVAKTYNDIQWKWGTLRGGTSGIDIGGQYLAFFHSSIDMSSEHSGNKKTAHYFMGAYTFSLDFPFEITQISPEPIVGKNFYNGKTYKPYWKPVTVVFPCGYIHDEEFIWVAYGREDHEIWIAKIDKQGLLDSLIPVTTK